VANQERPKLFPFVEESGGLEVAQAGEDEGRRLLAFSLRRREKEVGNVVVLLLVYFYASVPVRVHIDHYKRRAPGGRRRRQQH